MEALEHVPLTGVTRKPNSTASYLHNIHKALEVLTRRKVCLSFFPCFLSSSSLRHSQLNTFQPNMKSWRGTRQPFLNYWRISGKLMASLVRFLQFKNLPNLLGQSVHSNDSSLSLYAHFTVFLYKLVYYIYCFITIQPTSPTSIEIDKRKCLHLPSISLGVPD